MTSNQIFESFNHLNVMIIGDVIVDRYLDGKVDRISPEAPVPIIRLKNSDNRLGGAANVALNIKSMGANPFLFSIIGDDENGDIFEKLLPENEIWKGGIIRSKHRCTTVKTRVIASSQQLLRVDREDLHDLNSEEEDLFFEKIEEFLSNEKIDIIILQDYNKGIFSLQMIKRILKLAITVDLPIVVDPKKNNFFEYKNIRIFKPNLKEVRDSVPFDVQPNLDSLKKASQFLRSKSGFKNIVITLSENGIFVDNGNIAQIIPTQVRKIADVCGAGDSVISIIALCQALNLDLEEIAILSNLAGGQVCEKVGVVPIDKSQLKEEYLNLISR